MPLDILKNRSFNRFCLNWQLKFSCLPRHCFYTGNLLWFKLAYKGTAINTDLGKPLIETRWCDYHEYVFLKLKGTIE